MKLIKYIKSILLLKQVADAYEAETGRAKPPYLTRRFIGVLVATAGSMLTMYSSMELSPDMTTALTAHLGNVADSLHAIYMQIRRIIPDLVAIYGIVMMIVGYVKRKK